jgi:hypothetical protein
LVVSTPLKNMKVSWDDKNKKCSKPPTSKGLDCFSKVGDEKKRTSLPSWWYPGMKYYLAVWCCMLMYGNIKYQHTTVPQNCSSIV